MLQDAAGGGLIGVQALTKAVIGFVIGVAGGRLRVSQPLVQVPGLVVLTIVEGLARFALLQIFRFPAPFGELMTVRRAPAGVVQRVRRRRRRAGDGLGADPARPLREGSRP